MLDREKAAPAMVRWAHRAVVLACATPLLFTQAHGGELVSSANVAEGLVAQNRHLDAIEEMSWAVFRLWQMSPLTVRKSLFVVSEPQGFGVYEPRADAVFKRADPIYIYVEPVAFGYHRDGNRYQIDIGLDFEVKNKEGASVAKQANFGTFSLDSQVANREYGAKITYDFSGLQPGEYDVITTLNDRPTAKSASFTLSFTLTN